MWRERLFSKGCRCSRCHYTRGTTSIYAGSLCDLPRSTVKALLVGIRSELISKGRAIFSKRISRGKLLDFFAAQPSCTVALEACGGAHHWARQLAQLGHEVRLIPPAYVKPFVKRQKNDAIDAEAICEAAQRPSGKQKLGATSKMGERTLRRLLIIGS